MAGKKIIAIGAVLLVAVGVQVYWKRAAAAGNLGYRGSWDMAVAEARKSKKPILLNFGGDW